MNELSRQLTLGMPARRGLYDPALEKDACGVGFICDIKGRASRAIMVDANDMNCCMVHRGGVGYEKNTGDGAGILTALPTHFLRRVARDELDAQLPQDGAFGAGIVFLPRDSGERTHCKRVFESTIVEAGQRLIGWRELPIEPDRADIGAAARAAMPAMEQILIASDEGLERDALERKLYLIRKHATQQLRSNEDLVERSLFYVCSLSTKVIVYKGMLTPHQLFDFFPDLADNDYETHLAMVHSRFSTNTFPSWDRA